MKILYDHQIFSKVNYGGISRYFYELMKGLNDLGHTTTNSIKYSSNVFTKDSDIFQSSEFLPNINFRGKYIIKNKLVSLHTNKQIGRHQYDIFHPTYYDPYFIKNLRKKPFVVTFYDLIHEKFREKFPEQLSEREGFFNDRRTLLKESSKIIAISDSTKQDIIDLYNIDPEKIVVTHLANSLNPQIAYKDKSLGDYILFVGVRAGYKNFSLFAKAISPVLHKEKSLRLICAGGGHFSEQEINLLRELKIENQVVQMPIDDSVLIQLYYNAIFFVFPSMYEGFGIPVLEAFSCSCPTIIGNQSSLPEIAGDAALLVDPLNQEDITNQIESLLYNEGLRKSMIEKGLDQSKKFTWIKTSAATLDIYKSLL